MYKVKFDNGYVVNFDTEPSQIDIDEAASHISANIKPVPLKEQPKGFFKQISERASKVWDETKKNYVDMASRYDVAKAAGDKTALPMLVAEATAAAPKMVSSATFEALKQITPEPIKEDAKGFIGSVIGNPEIQGKIIQPLAKKAEEYPKTARLITAGTDIASVLPAPKFISESAKLAAKAAEDSVAAGKIATKAGVKYLEKSPDEIASTLAKNQEKIDDIVKTIVQGDKDDIATAKKSLTLIDTTGVKDYSELPKLLQSKADSLLSKVTVLLNEGADKNIIDGVAISPKKYKLNELKLAKEIGEEGSKKTIKYNFVNRAINNLQEVYKKTADIEGKELIKQLREKIKTEGLTLADINNLAKEYGTEIGKKAFNKKGDPLTSINAQMFENIRTGLKDTVKYFSKNGDAIDILDKEVSGLIKTKNLIQKLSDEIFKAEAKTKKEAAIMSVGRKAGEIASTVADVATIGSVKSFLGKFVKTVGDKQLSALDLQKMLRKNLIQIKKLNSETGKNFFNKLNEIIKTGE